jgi:hypothetical protein
MGASNKTGKEKFYTSEMSNLGTFSPTRYYGSSSMTKSSPTIYIKTTTIPDFIVDKKPSILYVWTLRDMKWKFLKE